MFKNCVYSLFWSLVSCLRYLLLFMPDISHIKLKLRGQLDPWQSSWDKHTGIVYSQPTYTQNAVLGIYRDSANGVRECGATLA